MGVYFVSEGKIDDNKYMMMVEYIYLKFSPSPMFNYRVQQSKYPG
jgi:hypothetical protein